MHPGDAATADADAFDDMDVPVSPAPSQSAPIRRARATGAAQATDSDGSASRPLTPRFVEPPRTWFGRMYDKAEAFLSRLSMRDNFWNSILSMIWLPLAFFSGIRMKELDAKTYVARAVLPFRRFNRNWYRAMAGGALLANSEIAGGSYVFGICGADYTVVCKHLEYKFLRPCLGPAVYRIKGRENIQEMMAAASEFNITVDMDILQQASRMGERDKRVGQCVATFHVTPKAQHKVKKLRKR